jgi:hypothetical protein
MALRFPVLSVCLLAFAAAFSSSAMASNVPDQSSFLAFTKDKGFCLRGVAPVARWEPALGSDDAAVWGSFCDNGNSTGQIVSDRFLAPSNLSFFIAGFVGNPGLRLYLRNLESGEEFDLKPQPLPGDGWRLYSFSPPQPWIGKPVELIGEDKATGVEGWFAFTAPRLPYSYLSAGYIPTAQALNGFCRDGRFPQVSWGNNNPPPGVVVWRSYCSSGDKDTGFVTSESLIAGKYVALYVAGYPGSEGVRLHLENLSNREQLPLQLSRFPYEVWQLYYFPLPREWKGQLVRVVADDNSTGPRGWVAFALLPKRTRTNGAAFGFRLLLLTLGIFVVTILPAAVACVVAVRRGIRSALDLTMLSLLAIALVGYVAFWSYFFHHMLGVIFSWASLLLCVGILAWQLASRNRRAQLASLRVMAAPLLLMATATLFIVSLGFIYGKSSPLQEYSAERFGPPFLSVDNWIPKLLADNVYSGHIPRPMVGNWLSSDRPPLQAGNALWNYPWTHADRDLSYQILGIVLQFTFLAGLWAYLDAAGVSRKAAALVMAAALFAGFTIENSFFVWPKLYPAAFLLVISAYLFTGRYTDVRRDWRVAAAVGAAAAFAMLGHGGSAFGLFGIALTALVFRRAPAPRFILTAAVLLGLVYLPWSLYQKYVDPPGDRLLKMHIAGTPEPHPEIKFSTLLVTKYGQLTWHQIVANKIIGFAGLFDDGTFSDRMHDLGRFLFFGTHHQKMAESASLRDVIFFRWFWSIDILSFVIFLWLIRVLVRRPRSQEFRQATILWICTAFALSNWCLLMFSGGTIVHQGCYFTEIAAFAASVLTLWAVSPRFAGIVVACHAVLALVLYAFIEAPQPVGVGTLFGPANTLLAVATTVSAVGFVLVLAREWNATSVDAAASAQRQVISQARMAIGKLNTSTTTMQ